jgi:uncharacterized repeat protein (TIGR01451 family)
MKILDLLKKIGITALACAALFLITNIRAMADERQVLPGHVPAAANKLRPIERLSGSTPMYLAIGLPLRHKEELDKLIEEIYDPSSANYRHYLTPQEFTERFCPTEKDYQALIAFANANHLTVTNTHPNRMILDVSGTAADIENAFKVTMQLYQHPKENRTFYAPSVEPSVPSELQVITLSGINNYTLPHPKFHAKTLETTSNTGAKIGSGPGGTYMGDDFRNAYMPNVTLTGAGQSVGLLQFDGYLASDITAYELLTGRPNVPLLNVLLDGFNGQPSPFGGSVEVSLDIEMVIAMAPGVSQVVVYMAGPFGIHDDILNRMANDNICKQLSCSWGWSGGPSAATEQIFKQMAAQGQTFFDASGDGDAFLPGQVDDPSFTGSPSSSPNITQVGGTTLTTPSPGGPWQSEMVWNWGITQGLDGVGSSGGISSFYPLPTYQQGIDMTANMGSTTFRNIPDVGLTGDNVLVIAFGGNLLSVGGTSCAAPLWGGLTALVNQQGAAAGAPPVGFLNPAIYAIGKGTNYTNCFHDITTGNNTWSLSPGQFFAVPGYDLCDGWGTPNGQNLINALTPGVALPNLIVFTNIVSGGNGNGVIDFDECDTLDLVLTNNGTTNATGVKVSVSTTTPGVIVAQKNATFPDIPVGGIATNLVSFKISTSPNFVCGTPVVLNLLIKCDQIASVTTLTLPSGVPQPLVSITNASTVNIPDNNPTGTNSVITVNNLSSILDGVTVSVNIIHPRVGDLTLQLISPDGTTATLSRTNGLGGANYGADCFNETTFDDAALALIDNGTPPFVGTFRPDQPLAAFIGKSGSGLNGNWKLHVVDSAANQTGFIQCWTLNLSTATCTNGGGQCPGVDMAVAMSASPSPVTVQSNLTYTISVTNNGPDAAKGVAVSQTLGPGEVFVTGSASQGTVTASGSTVSCTLGNMAAGSNATISVVVVPTATGAVFSTATVSSSVQDIDPSNNSATVGVLVNPQLADLVLSLTGSVNPVPLGGLLTYTVSVTNRGPVTAQNVVVTNLLPASVSIVSVSSSQGTSASSTGKVINSLGMLAKGASATVTIQVRALVVTSITTTSTVGSSTTDPIPANNTAALTTAVSPASDLSLTMTGNPISAAVGSNITYTLTVLNLGPSAAPNVSVNDTLPANVTYISGTCPQGTVSQSGTAVTCTITNLGVNSNATVTIVVGTAPLISQVPVTITNTATVSAGDIDPNPGNNNATVSTRVDNPRSLVVAAGSVLAAEGFSPTNGFIDPGETVTVNFRLQNIGNLNTTNLVATLQSTGGVLLTNGPQAQSYGALAAGGAGVFRPFTFAANVTNGGTLTATLQLQDGAANLGTAKFTYILPTISSFTNTNTITIPDHGEAAPYPSVINVSGVSGLIDRVIVTMTNVNHTFADDIGMLLVGPAGQSTLMMSHCGGSGGVSNVSLTLNDFAPAFMPTNSQIVSGSYKPTQNGSVSFPLTNTPAGPYGTNFANSFDGTNANGSWSLYVFDGSPGDAGMIVGGWSLAIATGTPVNDIVDLGVSGIGSPSPVLAGTNLTYTFTVTNNGPNVANSIAFTNILPANLSFVSAVSSQGICSTDTNGAIFCTLTNLAVGSSFTVTVVTTPTLPGVVTNIATVTSADSDLNQSDNSAVIVTTVTAPTADLAVGLSGLPSPAVVGSNLLFTINVTNNGPGTAFNVVAAMPLGNLTFVPAASSPGFALGSNGIATCTLGTLASGANGAVLLAVVPPQLGLYTNVASVATASSDPNTNNNSATLVITAANPAPNIIPAGTVLLIESYNPPNGTVDPGETVTVSFGMTNAGTAATSNMFATLVASNGVTPLSGAIAYGRMAPGDPAKFNVFSFSAPATNTGVLSVVFQLQDGSTSLGTAIYNFNLPATNAFANTSGMAIPDSGPALPYPSSINVSGLTGVVEKVTVTLSNLSHQFPNDLEMLLVGPDGRDALLMTSAGGAQSITNITLTFDDAAASMVSRNGPIVSGTYKLSDYSLVAPFPGPAPATPYGSALAAFNASNPNGIWSLYVLDDSPGDSGSMGGWSLSISSVNPVNSAADVGVTIANPPGLVFTGQNFNYTLNVTNRGPAAASSVTVTESLPFNLNFVSTSLGSYSNQSGTLTFSLGSLPAGTNLSFTVTLNSAVEGVYNSTATVAADQTDLNPADNTAQIATSVITATGAHLSADGYANGSFNFTLTGIPGQYALEVTTNLVNWTTISTNTVPSLGVLHLTDPNASAFSNRYYRVYFVGP